MNRNAEDTIRPDTRSGGACGRDEDRFPGHSPAGGEAHRGGTLGAPCALSIDLTKRGDVQMVKRAVANGWPVSPNVMRRIIAQVPAALRVLPERSRMQLVKLLVQMEARRMLAEGYTAAEAGASAIPIPAANRRRKRRRR